MTEAEKATLPRTRFEAISAGVDRYFTGKPCVNGHVAERRSPSGHCVDCIRATGKKRSVEERKQNPERVREYFRNYAKKYYQKNIERSRAYHRERRRLTRATPRGAINNRMASGINSSIRSGSKRGRKWEELVGYTIADLMVHLESRFADGMSWDNYGEWHIDHTIPKSVHNYETPDHIDFKRCWALSNLQPMWAADNISKNAKLENPFQPSLALSV